MELNRRQLQCWLGAMSGCTPFLIERLRKEFVSEEEIFSASYAALLQVPQITEKQINRILASKNIDKIKWYDAKMQEKDIRYITVDDPAYPSGLKEIHNKPYGLFVRGKMPNQKQLSIAIVGARNCTSYGKEMARWFGKELSDAGVQVISGMAYGIDGYAHRGALQGKTATYAVLGSGIDVCYPQEHFELYMELMQQGGVLSEYGLGVLGKAYQFPMRNRIISGMCDGVLVVEARQKSGSLITADLALEQGKEIFAVPGRIGDPLSKGCLELVKQGAELVMTPEDLIQNFHLENVDARKQLTLFDCLQLLPQEKEIYDILSFEPISLAQLLEQIKGPMWEVANLLMQMEMKGVIQQPMPNYYMRCIGNLQ
ncbi:MAG: DNA-processing protein DprA [Lachnospiraceae bacterium]|nr:DNA-processing protein DprA [Lachnospiraceae bacterium]